MQKKPSLLSKNKIRGGSIESKAELLVSTRFLMNLGVKFYATRGTAKFMVSNSIPAEILNWPLEKKAPNAVDLLKGWKN